MAFEAVLVTELEPPINFIVADGTAITKGALLQLTDPMTASAVSAADQMLAGIAAQDKVANDGKTRLGVYRRGIFRMTSSGSLFVGQSASCASSAVNMVRQAPVTVSGSAILGQALETASNGEEILLYVNVGAGGNQIS